MNLNEKYKTLFNSYHVNTPLRIAHFMAQIEHESGLKLVRENMNYSAKRIVEIFKTRLDRNKDGWLDESEKSKIREIANNPVRLANFVYANRFGNGNEASGDGFKYRAGGYLGTTFKDNYTMLSKDVRIDFINNPDLLSEEPNAMISALWFWGKHKLNDLADLDNIEAITKKINGGFNGLADRKKLLIKWKSIVS